MTKPKPKKQKVKPVCGWCVKNNKNGYLFYTLSSTRKECISFFSSVFTSDFITPTKTYRCVKVKIEEV